jgi:putative Mg2+ transporter-C (MgtC) family protein
VEDAIMPVILDWKQIAIRLLLSVGAGLIIGFNRGEHGRPAGMRTTLLVCLAASLSMLLANLLMDSRGKAPDSFIVLDLMRLPLGVLSGMGFIGAGTIIRKGNLVQGVTTAATLWFVTIMGLCFGSGQLGLGLAALAIGWLTLWGLKHAEKMMRQDIRGTLTVVVGPESPGDTELQKQIVADGCTIVSWGMSVKGKDAPREIRCELQWRTAPRETLPPSAVIKLTSKPFIQRLSWQPQGLSAEGSLQQTMAEGTPVPISR